MELSDRLERYYTDTYGEEGYTWDSKLARYRDKKTGRLLSRKIILALTKGRVRSAQADMDQSITDLINGNLSLRDWHRDNAERLKTLGVQGAILGRGGKDRTQVEDYLEVGRELKDNQYPRLRQFAKDLRDGKLSKREAKARMKMYAGSFRIHLSRAQKSAKREAGYKFGQRFLGACSPHCAECVAYAARGVVPAKDVVPIATRCSCLSNCCCSIRWYRSREEANSS